MSTMKSETITDNHAPFQDLDLPKVRTESNLSNTKVLCPPNEQGSYKSDTYNEEEFRLGNEISEEIRDMIRAWEKAHLSENVESNRQGIIHFPNIVSRPDLPPQRFPRLSKQALLKKSVL